MSSDSQPCQGQPPDDQLDEAQGGVNASSVLKTAGKIGVPLLVFEAGELTAGALFKDKSDLVNNTVDLNIANEALKEQILLQQAQNDLYKNLLNELDANGNQPT